MTPVTSERMRALASDLDAVDMALPQSSGFGVHVLLSADALRAAADEVDRLRKVIEDAPHDPICAIRARIYALRHCTCWKEDAL
jgi:hypothetical protein